MKMMMGPKVYYAPDAVSADTADGSTGQPGQPVQGNAEKGKATGAWKAQLSKDIRNNEELMAQLAPYNTVSDLVTKLFLEKQETETRPEEKPETGPVKYENFTKKLTAEDDPFGDMGNGLVEYFQKKGWKQKDAEEFFDALPEIFQATKKTMLEKAQSSCDEAVRKMWGNDYDRKYAVMLRGKKALGDTDGSLEETMKRTGVSINPVIYEILYRVGELVSEDEGSPTRGTGGAVQRQNNGVPIDYSKPST